MLGKAEVEIKVYNRRERGYEVLAFCDNCLSRIVDEYELPAYEIVRELLEPVDCENEYCETRERS